MIDDNKADDSEMLLRYHFGDLDSEELATFERRLAQDTELAERLEKLQECLASKKSTASDCLELTEMPRKLADRTCTRVLRHPSEPEPCSGGSHRFSLLETVVVGVCALIMGSLLFPAMQTWRESSRRIACQNSMREISLGLMGYKNEHNDRFPIAGFDENAGIFSVALAEGDFFNREELQRALLCPASPLAQHVAEKRAAVVVPWPADMGVANSLTLDRLIRFMAGSYAYRLGYDAGNGYTYEPSNLNCRVALMADVPQRGPDGSFRSRSHGPSGQNVLFEDGHVEFVSGSWSPCHDDHLFLNDDKEVAAGKRERDVVLAPSEVTPSPKRVVRVQIIRMPAWER